MTEWPGKNVEIIEGSGNYKVPSVLQGKGNKRPAYYVSWYDAIAFCNALSAKEGLRAYYDENGNIVGGTGYRLPTEKEWEYAAGHGGFNSDGTPKARFDCAGTSDDNEIGVYAWYGGNNSAIYGVKDVKTKKVNELGLYDMSGNVWEWCYDWSTVDLKRARRGGSFNNSASNMRVVYCYGESSSNRVLGQGFRVARNAN